MEAQPQCSCRECGEVGGLGGWGNSVWGHSGQSQLSDWCSLNTTDSHFVVGETDTLETERLPEAHPLMGTG